LDRALLPKIWNPVLSVTSENNPGYNDGDHSCIFNLNILISISGITITMIKMNLQVSRRTGAFAPHVRKTTSARHVCRASSGDAREVEKTTIDRRVAMLSMVSGLSLVSGEFSPAFAQEYETFFGAASPPTSYGGYGGNADEDAKYKFEYPAGWKPSVPNKVEKGTQGIDCRVTNVCGFVL
jgi:hypothetical protein